MRQFLVSTLVSPLEQFSPGIESLQLTGANLSKARSLRYLLQCPELEALEVFLNPVDYQRRDTMAAIAKRVLPADRMGQGVLRFYSIYDLPQIWADRQPRVLVSLDTDLFARDRYLRDRFAIGPMIISCQTHGMALPETYTSLAQIADLEAVPYDVIACQSPSGKATLERTFGGYLLPEGAAPRCQLEVVPNPIDLDRFRPADADARKRARNLLNLPQEGTIALVLGRMTPNSKCDLLPLIRQFAKVRGPDDLLVVVGVENIPGYAAAMTRAGAALGLQDRLIVRSQLDHWAAPLYYSAADLFVFPCDNIQEGFANTVLEAMASGLPTIVSDWDGPGDLVKDGVNGFLIPTYLLPGLAAAEDMYFAAPIMTTFLLAAQNTWVDEEVLGDRLAKLLRDPALRAEMGARGRAIPEQDFEWRKVCAGLFAIWDHLMPLAVEEADSVREKRRSLAGEGRFRVPLRRLFEPYATAPFDAARGRVSVTADGHAILSGSQRLEFYDETLPLIRPELVEMLKHLLRMGGQSTMAGLADQAATATGNTVDAAMFHLGLLAKRGVIRVDFTP